VETCNGIDDNCDGRIDEGCTENCGNGKDDNANGQVDEGCTDICGNGIDDNGNGQVDENCEPVAPPDATLGSSDPIRDMNNGCSIGDWAGKDPVQLSNRSAVTEPFTDFEITVLGRLAVTRTYASADALETPAPVGLFGIGWHHNWEMSLTCTNGGQACTLEGNLAAPRKFALEPRSHAGVGALAGESLALYRRSEPEASGFGGHDLMVRRQNGQFIVFLSDGSELRFSAAGCASCMGSDLNGKARLVQVTDPDGEWVNVTYDTGGDLIRLEDELGNSLAVASTSSCASRAGRLAYRSGSNGAWADYITYEYDSTCELLVRAVPVGYTPAPGKTAQLRAYQYHEGPNTPRKGLLRYVRNESEDPVVQFDYIATGQPGAGEVASIVDSESTATVRRTQAAQDLVTYSVTSGASVATTHTRGAGWKANQIQSVPTGLPAASPSRKLAWKGRFLVCSEDAAGLRYFERDAHGRATGVADLVPPSRGGTYSCSSSSPPDLATAPRHVKYEYGVSKVIAEGIVLSLDTSTATARRSVFTDRLTNTSGSRSWAYPTRESLDFDPTPKATDPAGYTCAPAGASAGSRYDLGGGPVAVGKLRPCRRTVSGYVLDAAGNAVLREVATFFTWDERGRLTRTIGPVETAAGQTWIGRTDPVEERTYWPDGDADPKHGRLNEVRRWVNGWTALPSDSTVARSLVTAIESYDVFGPTQIREPSGALTVVTRVNGAGRVTRIDAPGGTTRIRYYDGQMPRLVLMPGGSAKRMSYDLRGRLAAIEQVSADPEPATAIYTKGWKEAFEYDLAGNLALHTRTDAAGNVTWKQATKYDGNHHPWKVEHPTPGSGETLYNYGLDGRLESVEDPDWRKASFGYDDLGRTSAVDRGRYLEAPGSVTRHVRQGSVTTYGYEPESDLVEAVYAHLAGSSQPMLLARYVHDDFGRVQSVRGYNYSHDARGNVLRRTGGGRTIDYEYDGLNRLTKLTATRLADGSAITYSYAYGFGEPEEEPMSTLTVTEPDRTVTLEYDGAGRLGAERVAESFTARWLNTSYTYDADGDLATVLTPAGLNVIFVRDRVTKEITEVRNQVTGTKYASSVKHLPWGPVTDLTFANGQTLAAGFNLRYEPDAISSGTLELSYTMSPAGDVRAEGAADFEYDVQDRLASSSQGAGSYVPMTYIYRDNRLREAAAFPSNQGRYAFHYDAAENLSAVSEYDSTGLSLLRTTCFVHDALGRLTTVGPARVVGANAAGLACQTEADLSAVSVRFRYDYRNRRVARQDGTGPWKHWVFTPDGQPLAEMEKPATSQGTWTVLREYVWLQGRPIAQIEYPGPAGGTEGHVYAVHTDHLGQPRILTSRTGVVVWSAPVERPYGEVTETITADPASGRQVVTNLRLPGQHDERLLTAAGIQGPYYNWHRWYLPSMGRYMELDPIAVAGGFNGRYGPDWYGYAEGNPNRYVDPRGEWIWVVAGAGIGAVVNVTMAAVANGGSLSASQVLAAAASGAISGALGAVAGPLGGTLARSLGFASNGVLAAIGSAGASAVGGALGQVAANSIDPCHGSSVANAALWAGVGGGIGKYAFPTRNLNTLSQAAYFGPSTMGGLFGTPNAWLNMGSFGASAGVGGAANFSSLGVF